MNLNELVTYIEELTFRTTMFGYDRDEVDVQLDKINDEIMDLVKAKDAEIAALKSGEIVVEASDPSVGAEKTAEPEKKEAGLFDLYGEEGDEEESADTEGDVVKAEPEADDASEQIIALREQIADLEEQLRVATERAEIAEAQLDEANERADHLENRVLELEEELADLEEEEDEDETSDSQPAEEVISVAAESEEEDDEEDEEPAVLLVDEETEEVEEPEMRAPANTDEAYNQYMRNADLLCRQLSLIDDQKESILGDARTQADGILTQARTKADTILEEANVQAEIIVGDANTRADEIRADVEEQKKTILEEAYAEKDERIRNLEEDRIRFEELAKKKAEMLNSLRELSEEVQALADDYDDELEDDGEEEE